MVSTYAAEVPDRETWPGLPLVGQRSTLIDELPQQRVHGNPPPLRFGSQSVLGVLRDFNGHGAIQFQKSVAAYRHSSTKALMKSMPYCEQIHKFTASQIHP
jgi:hypothetical protein